MQTDSKTESEPQVRCDDGLEGSARNLADLRKKVCVFGYRPTTKLTDCRRRQRWSGKETMEKSENSEREKRRGSSGAARGCMADLAKICNSSLAQGVATALAILAILLGLGGCIYLERTGQAQVDKAREK